MKFVFRAWVYWLMPRRRSSIRDLYHLVRDYRGDALAAEVLVPWVVEDQYAAWLAPAGTRAARTDATVNTKELYALNRIFDALILPFQPVSDDPAVLDRYGNPRWEGMVPSTDALPDFAAALGLTAITGAAFFPFLHLLMLRGGVVVRAGAAVIDPELGMRSTLFWAWWRRNRPAADLWHGWGHNSQWGTDFRRDYWIDDTLYCNADAPGANPDPDDTDPVDPPADQRDELLRHRCSTTADLSDS